MKRFRTALCLLLLIPPFAIAQAEDIGLSKEFDKCMDKAVSTMYMIDCMTEENSSQDKRLNRAYKSLMETLSAERKKKLQEAQRAWIKYRDANCDYYNDPEGGSMARIGANNCVLDATARRAQELENFKKAGE